MSSDCGCIVNISCPTNRFDNAKVQLTIANLRKKLSMLNREDVILNDNINSDHAGRKGLHLNERGSGRLAVNFMSHMRRKH